MSQYANLKPVLRIWLEKALLKATEGDEWDKTKLHASDTGYAENKCKRQLKLRLNGEEQKHTIGTTWRFYKGHKIEAMIHELLTSIPNESWELISWNADASDYPILIGGGQSKRGERKKIHGTTDFVFKHKETGELAVVDCKAVRGRKFEYLEKQGPDINYVAQVQRYMAALKANYGYILYVDTEGENWIRIYDVIRDDKSDANRVLKITNVLMKNELPPIIKPDIRKLSRKPADLKENHVFMRGAWYSVNEPWQCDWCSYKKDAKCIGAVEEFFRKLNK